MDEINWRAYFAEIRTIAVVGLSDNPNRDSYHVASYLLDQGYEVIPVNPAVSSVLSRKAYASLKDIPGKIDLVDVFRRSDAVPEIVHEAIALGVKRIWLQLGVTHQEAEKDAREHGVEIISDRCIKIEHHRMMHS
ncbi:CoA-binding protein [Ferroacidibacillus organovorans]|uniref:CoA-binding protein n=1 Tax=Ferroacidibacillus organovorans TaxID=1765683 RepID=A0A101XQV2_9BACL|nr:CoA-binding protein [Ferroacidibacillus organovorans]KUO95859.1 CoA-binding protein [Ferroacidibacillus organovorans]